MSSVLGTAPPHKRDDPVQVRAVVEGLDIRTVKQPGIAPKVRDASLQAEARGGRSRAPYKGRPANLRDESPDYEFPTDYSP